MVRLFHLILCPNDNVKHVFLLREYWSSAICDQNRLVYDPVNVLFLLEMADSTRCSFELLYRLKKLRGVWGPLKRMKQQKLTMGEVNKWAIHTEPFIAGPPALCLQIARFQPIYRGWGRARREGAAEQLGRGLDWDLEIDRAARAWLGSPALPVPCPAAAAPRFLPLASLPHYIRF